MKRKSSADQEAGTDRPKCRSSLSASIGDIHLGATPRFGAMQVQSAITPQYPDISWCFAENSEMSDLVRKFDWASTSVGPIHQWPASFKTSLSICMTSRFPMFLWLGPELRMVYNDAYKPLMGTKHPKFLGLPGKEGWPEIWDTIGPMLASVTSTGRATWFGDLLLVLNRHGYLEETYWTCSYSPIRSSSDSVEGIFSAVEENTARCFSERRLATLRDLSMQATPAPVPQSGPYVDVFAQTCNNAIRALANNPNDIPFACLYRIDPEHNQFVLQSVSSSIGSGIAGISPLVVRARASNAAIPSSNSATNDDVDVRFAECISRVLRTGILSEFELHSSTSSAIGPIAPWQDTPHTVVALPLSSKARMITLNAVHDKGIDATEMVTDPEADLGVLIVAVNTHKKLDEQYLTFLNLVASHTSSLLVAARAYQQERKRAEMLQELDRAKTTFFSNISHEFRTPLTLMIGPLEELIEEQQDNKMTHSIENDSSQSSSASKGTTTAVSSLSPTARDSIMLVHRNSMRLLKLVNVLLDFSRIEAGRMQATYVPADLTQFTSELASVFRSACEKAGLQLIVKCDPLPEPVFVDVDMWEKVVLNLLSNAYKYTLNGKIEVCLRTSALSPAIEKESSSSASSTITTTSRNSIKSSAATLSSSGTRCVELSVRDTGCGIPAAEMPRLFERFHRIQSSRGRNHEGTGIGLALVFELVKLHGGTIRAESVENVGSTFYVSIPYGKSHLPAEHVQLIPYTASHEREEESQLKKTNHLKNLEWWWLNMQATAAKERPSSGHVLSSKSSMASILVVEDNADMQQYITRILSEHYHITTVDDGIAALETLRKMRPAALPDLVLSDLMMPRLDGFGLLKAMRDDELLKEIPMIFLSAQAGEEARSEGLVAGADDYLVKPFSAKELVTRVSARIELARVRSAAAKKEQSLREEAERASKAKDTFLAVLSHELRNPLVPVLLVAEDLQRDTSLSARTREDLTLIARNVQLEVHLINDLLDITKINQQKLTLQAERLDAHELLQHVLRTYQPNIKEKQIQVELNLSATQFTLMADPARLQQIYWNLLGNAIKFTPENGTIKINSLNVGSQHPRRLRVEFIDSGIGIEPEVLNKLFNAFEQGGAAVNRKFGGLGLGLSIARALTTMQSGTLTAFSQGRHKGAAFTLEFPTIVDSPSKTPARVREFQPGHEVHPLHIILIEDNVTNLLVMKRMLAERLHHRVETATTFAEAVTLLARQKSDPFDIILCDLGLPDGDGLDLMPHIRANHPQAKCIALTGYGTDEDIERSSKAGFALHLTKPVSSAQLERALMVAKTTSTTQQS